MAVKVEIFLSFKWVGPNLDSLLVERQLGFWGLTLPWPTIGPSNLSFFGPLLHIRRRKRKEHPPQQNKPNTSPYPRSTQTEVDAEGWHLTIPDLLCFSSPCWPSPLCPLIWYIKGLLDDLERVSCYAGGLGNDCLKWTASFEPGRATP